MMSGMGSDAARGNKLRESTRPTKSRTRSGPVQDVYEDRFIAYLGRFLLNYDPAARLWWD